MIWFLCSLQKMFSSMNFNKSLLYFLVLLNLFCLSTIAMADRTYLGLLSYSDQEIFSGEIGVSAGQVLGQGVISGCFTGIAEVDTFYLSYDNYDFMVGNYLLNNIYSGYLMTIYDYNSNEVNGAIYGDIGATIYNNNYNIDFDLTSFLGTQYSGKASWATISSADDLKDCQIYLNVSAINATAYIQSSDIGYAGLLNISGNYFKFSLDGLNDMSSLSAFIGTYDWSGNGLNNDGNVYAIYLQYTDSEKDPIILGEFTGTLEGILIPTDDYMAFIEHANTAAPIPLPSTLFLLGSGLLGLVSLKRRL